MTVRYVLTDALGQTLGGVAVPPATRVRNMPLTRARYCTLASARGDTTITVLASLAISHVR